MRKQVKAFYSDVGHGSFQYHAEETIQQLGTVSGFTEGWSPSWHAMLRRRIKRGPQISAKWGRWLPENRFNVDQVLFTLSDGSKETYEDVGEGRVWICGSKKGDDKREATLQLCVRLSNTAAQPKPTFIFRGKGLRLKQTERDSWDDRANVMFQ